MSNIVDHKNEKGFSWVPTHKAIANKLFDYETKQEELVRIIKNAGIKGIVDKDVGDTKVPLSEMDPFTFFCFIYKHGVAKQLEFLRKISEHFGVQPLPEGQNGIPSAQGLSVKLFPHKKDRNNNEIRRLWSFFKDALANQIDNEQFADILKIVSVGKAKITEVLFYVKPEEYLPVDGQTIPYLKEVLNINPDFETWDEYLAILKQVREHTKDPFYKVSYDAWYWNTHRTTNYWIFQGNPNHFDVVSALRNNALRTWNIKSHKQKIKRGDKVILWLSGEDAGCYALCTVDSDVTIMDDEVIEKQYYKNPESIKVQERVKLKIDYNLCDNPIYKDHLLKNPVFKNFPAGNQGTNFKANKEQYETILTMIEQKPTIRFWLYAPGRNAMYWNECLKNNIMCFGDDNLGELRVYQSKEQIRSRLKELSGGKSEGWNDALTLYNISRVMQPGDIIIAKQGRTQYLGYGVVASDYYYDNSRDTYKQSRRVEWKSKESFPEPGKNIAIKSLTEITQYPDYVNRLKKLWNIQVPAPYTMLPVSGNKTINPLNIILYGPPGTGKTYHTVNEALKIMNPEFDLQQDRALVKQEFNHMVQEGRIVFATFHQSMSYEDFVEGIKPVDPGSDEGQVSYRLENGIFKELSLQASGKVIANQFEEIWTQFTDDVLISGGIKLETPMHKKQFTVTINSRGNCVAQPDTESATAMVVTKENIQKYIEYQTVKEWTSYTIPIVKYLQHKYKLNARPVDNPTKPYVLIIDEINRGNVSQIFGELITLIEPDKRAGMPEALEVVLPYSKEKFSVPPNLHIIGTMNTADRSVEALDTALRRRFSFREMPPKPVLIITEGALKNSEGKIGDIDVVKMLETINQRIERLIDHDHCIGHSYFMDVKTVDELKLVFIDKVIPLLKEYFFGDFGKIGLVLGKSFVRREKETQVFASFDDYGDSQLDLAERPVYKMQGHAAWDFTSIYL